MDDLLLQPIVQPNPHRPAEAPQDVGPTKPKKYPYQELGLTGLNHVVDDDFDQPRRDQFERSRQPGKQKRADHQGTVRAEIVEHSKQGFHRRKIFTESRLNGRGGIVLPVPAKFVELRER